MDIRDFQKLIERRYGTRDKERGTPATFMWFVEEVGELATALAGDDMANKQEEFADVFAWMCTLANINGVDIEQACEKYIDEKRVQGYK
jgi:NTP pyrophosphatase (non-canonical NTP hydrolase)